MSLWPSCSGAVDVFGEGQQQDERIMDSNPLVKQRGITILAQSMAITYEGTKVRLSAGNLSMFVSSCNEKHVLWRRSLSAILREPYIIS
jgi:hypothetical protein